MSRIICERGATGGHLHGSSRIRTKYNAMETGQILYAAVKHESKVSKYFMWCCTLICKWCSEFGDSYLTMIGNLQYFSI